MDIVDKIKKLMALGRSSNPYEAARALEKAEALIAEYGISHEQILLKDITNESVPRAGFSQVPPLYEARLMKDIAGAFGVRMYFDGDAYGFYGKDYRCEIAVYIATVLLRKMRSVRSKYLATLKRSKKSTKTKKADEYMLGWTVVVSLKLIPFAISADDEKSLDTYQKETFHFQQINPIKRGFSASANDYLKGFKDGSNIELQHGVKGQKKEQAKIEAGE